MSIYFGSTTDGELISELAQRGYLAIPLELESVAFRLAEKELAHLSEENFGRMPNDAWSDAVLNLRDAIAAGQQYLKENGK